MNEIKEQDFKGIITESDVPVLVDFFAPWCGPCRALAPALEGIAKSYEGRLKVVKVNVDDCQNLAYQYNIRGVPALMMFRDGKVVDSIVGLPPLSVLRGKLESLVESPVIAAR